MKKDLIVKEMVIAALSLWEGGDDPETNLEYLKGQAETIARFMQYRGWDIPSGGATSALLAAAKAISRGESSPAHVERAYQTICG